jgi:hypothetical protein
MAQLVEQRIRNAKVAGSSPVSGIFDLFHQIRQKVSFNNIIYIKKPRMYREV